MDSVLVLLGAQEEERDHAYNEALKEEPQAKATPADCVVLSAKNAPDVKICVMGPQPPEQWVLLARKVIFPEVSPSEAGSSDGGWVVPHNELLYPSLPREIKDKVPEMIQKRIWPGLVADPSAVSALKKALEGLAGDTEVAVLRGFIERVNEGKFVPAEKKCIIDRMLLLPKKLKDQLPTLKLANPSHIPSAQIPKLRGLVAELLTSFREPQLLKTLAPPDHGTVYGSTEPYVIACCERMHLLGNPTSYLKKYDQSDTPGDYHELSVLDKLSPAITKTQWTVRSESVGEEGASEPSRFFFICELISLFTASAAKATRRRTAWA
jgi:hypothetical protein